jgi:selenocysteine lyase/cysteine desulfurase
LSFWDFAAAAPYVDIDMYPECAEHPLAYKDAVFISPHKFVGGPGTPGVLVVRRELLTNRVPTVVGGGTVEYVNPSEHRYVDDPVQREEGGTPAIIEAIRAGLVFQLKQAVGVAEIRAHEESYWRRAVEAWAANPAIEVLGNTTADRLSILSFVIRRQGGKYVHHNFVVALLNDLFGIQARGGCSCAGPYGHRLLHIDIERSREFALEIHHGCEGIKPGWTRVSFNYFISETVFQYLVDAVGLVASDGWKLLPDYRFDPASGLWRHRRGPVEPPLRLTDLRYDAATGALLRPALGHRRAAEDALPGYLDAARALLDAAPPWTPVAPQSAALSREFEHLRWFELVDACLTD